jgi:BCD family chlorophyll transporter-like MFS transporter
VSNSSSRFSVLRSIRLGSFHVGSAFADLLTSGVLNRVLISDLGIAATPVALLSALRFLLAPLSIWAGHRSDKHPFFGFHRLPYIWFGRTLMLISLPLLPLLTVMLAADPRAPTAWLLALLAFLIYGVGNLFSGSTFLALVHDSAPDDKRGQAIAIVQFFLVVSFPISALIYGRLMPVYDSDTFWSITWTGTALAAGFWFFALLGSEQRDRPDLEAEAEDESLPFAALLRRIWGDWRSRRFFLFLAIGAMSAFAQDAVLEPFGGDVFGMNAGETTLFNAYWGSGILLSMVATIMLTRRRPAHAQTGITMIGLAATGLPLALLGLIALSGAEMLLVPVLFLFGLGFGVYTVGAVSLLMAMTTAQHAGAYLGLWSVAQLLFRGIGISLGGLIRDLVLWFSGSLALAYAAVFLLSALGLFSCILLLARVDVPGFSGRDAAPAARVAALAD